MDRKKLECNIDVDLFVYRNLIFGSVLSFPEELRGCGTLIRYKEMGIVSSDNAPDLTGSALYLWGSNYREDYRVFARRFNSNTEATAKASTLREALNALRLRLATDYDISPSTKEGPSSDKKVRTVTINGRPFGDSLFHFSSTSGPYVTFSTTNSSTS